MKPPTMMLAPAGIIAMASSTETAFMMGTPITGSIDEWHCDEMVTFAQDPSLDLRQSSRSNWGEDRVGLRRWRELEGWIPLADLGRWLRRC
jgi:hypothetical protein